MDCHGRVFYIDHKNHKTTWEKPSTVSSFDGKSKSVKEREDLSSGQENSNLEEGSR